MIVESLKKIIAQNGRLKRNDYLLNLLKEELQAHILNFIYTTKDYQELIFTGGTCLRKVYGLDRLSVDIDLDSEQAWAGRQELASALSAWFRKEHRLSGVEATVRKESVKIKLTDIGRMLPEISRDVLFVTLDISNAWTEACRTEKNMISTTRASFIVKNYDLPTRFANKIAAFLHRNFFVGRGQGVPFKGRDVYDLFWFCQRSKKISYSLRPNFPRLFELLKTNNRREILDEVKEKVNSIDNEELRPQLAPYLADFQFLESFLAIYKGEVTREMEPLFA